MAMVPSEYAIEWAIFSSSSCRSALADRYRLKRRLGSGGTATVYLAHEHPITGVGLRSRRPRAGRRGRTHSPRNPNRVGA